MLAEEKSKSITLTSQDITLFFILQSPESNIQSQLYPKREISI